MKDKLKTKEAVISVKSEEEFNRLLEFLESRDICWSSNAKPTAHKDYYPIRGILLYNDWIFCTHQQCNYKYPLFTVDEFIKEESNVMRDTFTKDDLKDWMIVETAKHSIFLVDKTHGYLIHSGEHMSLTSYTDDLKCTGNYSIVKVYEPKRGLEFFLKLYLDGTIKSSFRKIEEDLNLIWERDEKPVEMTIAEIEEKLGIKNLKVVKENDND